MSRWLGEFSRVVIPFGPPSQPAKNIFQPDVLSKLFGFVWEFQRDGQFAVKAGKNLEARLVRDAVLSQSEFVLFPGLDSRDGFFGDVCIEQMEAGNNHSSVGIAELMLWSGLPDDHGFMNLWSYSDRRLSMRRGK